MTGEVLFEVRRELLRLARAEEELAERELAALRYWMPVPASIDGHRQAARRLREDAASLTVGPKEG